jgi:type IV secretory pathway VirJ component
MPTRTCISFTALWLIAMALTGGAEAGAHPRASMPLPANAKRMSHGRFEDFVVFSPAATPGSFVLFLSGDGGVNRGIAELTAPLVEHGAMVTAIDLSKFKAALAADGGQCVDPDGDLENLSHFVQAYFHLPTYLVPLLAGYGSGATLAYATLVQAPPQTFAGALSVGFCPAFDLRKPLCKGAGLEFTRRTDGRGVEFLPAKNLQFPWIVVNSPGNGACAPVAARATVGAFVAAVPGAAMIGGPSLPPGKPPSSQSAAQPGAAQPGAAQLVSAFDALLARSSPKPPVPPPAVLGDLPVVEVPASPGTRASDTFAIMLSGDGGWAGLDQGVAAALSADGIAVVGLDSLRYFWTARTPQGIAADMDRMIRYYLAHWGKKRVLLIGYSQGADVLPFAINRLPAATRASIALAAVLGISSHALFEFHLSSWVADDDTGPATMPEVTRMSGMPVLCMYGAEESGSLCPQLDPRRFGVVKLTGGHHFDGDYAGLAARILAAAAPNAQAGS